MLPLWIIDITSKSIRRDEFRRLVGKIEHVWMPDAESDEPMETEQPPVAIEQVAEEVGLAMPSEASEPKQEQVDALQQTIDEKLEEEEKQKAAREAVIKGNYWYYSSFEYEDYFKSIELTNLDNRNQTAQQLYDFQEAIIAEAKNFIMELRNSNAKPYQSINIAVLGDSTEPLTQLVFASIAAILQKEKGRFLPGHIHQGMGIFGMLYIPCDINTYLFEDRSRIQRLLNEIEVQHNLPSVRGYDRMMLYQNVQNRTECTYPKLSDEELAQYLLQCLVHLFLACDINHPLIHGTGSDDMFYFSMGATSVYFDMTVEDENDANKVASELLKAFKEEGDNGKLNSDLQLIDKSLYKTNVFIKTVDVDKLDLREAEESSPSPHPIHDFFHRNLKRLYYNYYLRFYPAELLRDVLQRIDAQTGNYLNQISNQCSISFKDAEITILPAITRVISKVNEHSGGLFCLEAMIVDAQQQMSKEKNDIQRELDRGFWQKIMYDRPLIPSDQLAPFEDYHDAYMNDIKSKNNGSSCKSMKDDVLEKLKVLLSHEKTVLATLSRCFFMGILCVLGILPILDFLSPDFINLGDVRSHAFPWGVVLFMLPLLTEFVFLLFYLRKRNKLIRELKAYYMHDGYARLANRIEFECNEFYDRMVVLFDEYLTRCKLIRKETNFETPNPDAKTLFPKGIFNQPLNGGFFGSPDNVLIPNSEIEGSRIKVNFTPRFVNQLSKSHYYLLINHFNNELAMLFKGVEVIDSHARRFDEKTNSYVFVSRDELMKQKDKQWEQLKGQFKEQLLSDIKMEMVPREFPTVGEKLVQYKKKINKLNLLEPMINYAATNGEVTSEADTEYADVKVNIDIEELVSNYLPLYTTRMQTAKYDEIYKKYIFITRWRCFEHFSFNRILPKEDFDQKILEERVYQEEMKAANRKQKKMKSLKQDDYYNDLIDPTWETKEPEVNSSNQKSLPISSVILWAVCPDDNSGEWLKLFDAEDFSRAYQCRKDFRKNLNKLD